MDQIDTTCEHIRLRLIAAAVGLQQCTKTAANVIPLPGTDRFIVIGTPAEVRGLLPAAPEAPIRDAAPLDLRPGFDVWARKACNMPAGSPVDWSAAWTKTAWEVWQGAAQAFHASTARLTDDAAIWNAVTRLERQGATCDERMAAANDLRLLAQAPHAGAALEAETQAARDVLAERRRQVQGEGMTNDGDDHYQAAELPRAAAAYILNGANDEAPHIWPWAKSWWKPRDARANYVRAAALLLAEIERIDRANPYAAPSWDHEADSEGGAA